MIPEKVEALHKEYLILQASIKECLENKSASKFIKDAWIRFHCQIFVQICSTILKLSDENFDMMWNSNIFTVKHIS